MVSGRARFGGFNSFGRSPYCVINNRSGCLEETDLSGSGQVNGQPLSPQNSECSGSGEGEPVSFGRSGARIVWETLGTPGESLVRESLSVPGKARRGNPDSCRRPGSEGVRYSRREARFGGLDIPRERPGSEG